MTALLLDTRSALKSLSSKVLQNVTRHSLVAVPAPSIVSAVRVPERVPGGAGERKGDVNMARIVKEAVCRERVRKIPPGFSWVDHRLVREHYVEKCSLGALALYLFLVTVSDAEGLSWWSERSLAARLGVDAERVRQARAELEAAELVAYEHPVWQVLPLKGGA